jgi:hypothetical protein
MRAKGAILSESPPLLLFAQALENQHVGVNRGADGEHDAATPGSVKVALSMAITPRISTRFISTAMKSDDTCEVVVADKEDEHDDQAHHARTKACGEVVGNPAAGRLCAR